VVGKDYTIPEKESCAGLFNFEPIFSYIERWIKPIFMPKPKDEKKRNDIQEAALKLVLQTGFNSLKMADVALEANVATGTLYVYYKSKELLINDVYHKTKKESLHALLDPSHATGNFYTTFKNMWMGYFDFCFQHPDKMLFVEQFIYSGLISEHIIEDTTQIMVPLHQFLAYGQQHKVLKKLDLNLAIAQLQGAIHETVKMLIKTAKTLPPSEIDKCFGITWDGLKYR
jgi:AcrR family transcriptional regulator